MTKMPTTRAAFTLIELLVVVSIIGVLVAMLLPALGKTRDQAMMLKCSTQTRATAMGTANYAADFRGDLPPTFNITPSSGKLYAGTKNLTGYWWYRVGGGMQRGAYLWPNYIKESETFYCPSTVGYADNPTYQSYHHNWTAQNFGTNTAPIAALVSYAYPAVKYEILKNNYGGDWTGIPGQNWTAPSGLDNYDIWKDSMLEQKIEANRSATPVSWDVSGDSAGAFYMHNGDAATISFIDGSSIQFKHVREIEKNLNTPWPYGPGMSDYRILPALRKFREEGTLP